MPQVFIAFPRPKIRDAFLAKKEKLPFSYPEVNASKKTRVVGYDNDHNYVFLGKGEAVWNNARKALQKWQQFPSTWTKVEPEETPLEVGRTVAVNFRLFGLWWLNAARIVYVLDETNRFGFAYGTLPGHVEQGEECFWIEKETNGEIYYHIRAFSKPRFWVTRLGYPLARYFQRQFVLESMKIMKIKANQHD